MLSVSDKAVSTEDLCAEEARSTAFGVLRLEAILNTLVENKVESLKNETGKSSSVHSSPKRIMQRLKMSSSPKSTLKIEDERKKEPKRKEKAKSHKVVSESRQFKRQVLRQDTSVSSPDSQIYQFKRPYEGVSVSDDERYRYSEVAHYEHTCMNTSCHSLPGRSPICYCSRTHGPMSTQFNEDYISLKMDGYGDIETDVMIAQEELRRARKKRRKRRKRKIKKRLAMNPHLVDTLQDNGSFKHLNDDELPPRAKWTIVATACLLLFMCLLLVGITLRMAPIIDEIGAALWRKQNQSGASIGSDTLYGSDSKR